MDEQWIGDGVETRFPLVLRLLDRLVTEEASENARVELTVSHLLEDRQVILLGQQPGIEAQAPVQIVHDRLILSDGLGHGERGNHADSDGETMRRGGSGAWRRLFLVASTEQKEAAKDQWQACFIRRYG